jgi:GTP-binding protein HflX
VDAHDPERQTRIEQVNEVLGAIGASDVPQILVYNKIDLSAEPAQLLRDPDGHVTRVWCAATSGEGIELLQQALGEYFLGDEVRGWLALPPECGRLRAAIYQTGQVLQEQAEDSGGWWLEIRISEQELDGLFRREGRQYTLQPERTPLRVAGAAQAP